MAESTTKKQRKQATALSTGKQLVEHCRHDSIDVWLPLAVDKVSVAVRKIHDKKLDKFVLKPVLTVTGYTPCSEHVRSSTWDEEKHIGKVETPEQTGEKEITTNMLDVEVGVVYLQRINKSTVLFPIDAGPNAKCSNYGFSADVKIKYGAKKIFKRASAEQIAVIVSEYGPVEEWGRRSEVAVDTSDDDDDEEGEDVPVVMQFGAISDPGLSKASE